MTKLYVIRCQYHEGLEVYDVYWNNKWGWSSGIEDAGLYRTRIYTLPIIVDNVTYTDVEWVELEVNDD